MTPLEELQHVLFGQLTHGNPTSDLECILDALTEAKAQGMEEAGTEAVRRVDKGDLRNIYAESELQRLADDLNTRAAAIRKVAT